MMIRGNRRSTHLEHRPVELRYHLPGTVPSPPAVARDLLLLCPNEYPNKQKHGAAGVHSSVALSPGPHPTDEHFYARIFPCVTLLVLQNKIDRLHKHAPWVRH